MDSIAQKGKRRNYKPIHALFVPEGRDDTRRACRTACLKVCHFSERSIRVTEKKSKHYEGGSKGVSIRIAKGVTYRTGKHKGVPVEDISYVKTKGLLYITNKRIVFVSDGQAFEKKFNTLTACVPYLNAIKLQFGNTTITLTVSDGNAVNMVITMINLGIQ